MTPEFKRALAKAIKIEGGVQNGRLSVASTGVVSLENTVGSGTAPAGTNISVAHVQFRVANT